MKMARVILFTGQMDEMSKFYGEVLGLKQVNDEKGWREFGAGSARNRAALRPVIARPQGSEDRIPRQGRSRSA